MPWYGTALPIFNPVADQILVDTGVLPSSGPTQTPLYNVQVYVWSDVAAIDVILQQVNPAGVVIVAQTLPVGFWAYFAFQTLQAQVGTRLRLRARAGVSGNVHASIAVDLTP